MRQQTSESFRPAPWYFSNTVLLAAMVVLDGGILLVRNTREMAASGESKFKCYRA